MKKTANDHTKEEDTDGKAVKVTLIQKMVKLKKEIRVQVQLKIS